jgi:hypothetical protein
MIVTIKYTLTTIRFWAIALLFYFMATGCESFVDVDLPSTQLTGETVFEDAATADAVLTHIYTKMRDEVLVTGSGSGISTLLGTYADELDYYSGATLPAQEFYQNSLVPTNVTVSTLWNSTYKLIYASNSILSGVSNSVSISQSDKDRLMGEAYFVRAYLHFYLVNMYGEIPYVVSTDYKINSHISKMSVSNVYAALTTDLQNAVTLLPEEYISSERVRPNRSTAYSLLARANLYSGDWSQALLYSDMVIASPLYTWVEDLNGVFLNSSTGTLWQLHPLFAGNNTLEAQDFIFFTGPPPAYALRNDFVSEFEAGDLRRNNWIGTVTDGTEEWYFPFKYKQNEATGSSVEYSILFRLEEQYLIRAEAKAQLNDLEGSKDDLNKIRNRAGLGNTPANTKQGLLDAILQERKMEFFSELGHRWFDLKRTGTAAAVLSVKKPGWDARDLLLPLPETELLLNTNLLPQNPGY